MPVAVRTASGEGHPTSHGLAAPVLQVHAQCAGLSHHSKVAASRNGLQVLPIGIRTHPPILAHLEFPEAHLPRRINSHDAITEKHFPETIMYNRARVPSAGM